MRIEFDTPFDPDHPLYTRANAGEVFPEVLTPLAWSVLGRSVEQGFRTSYCRHFGVLGDPGRDWFTIGRFAGRLHLNLSLIRTVAQRLPGTSAAATDRNFFGETAARGLPEHPVDASDGYWRRRGLPATLRSAATATRRVHALAEGARAEAVRTRAFLAADPTPAELLDRVEELCGAPYQELFGQHMTVRALSSGPTTMATEALIARGFDPTEAMRAASSIPDLESAKPSRALAAIAASVPVGSVLAASLAGGVDWAGLQVSDVDGAGELAARIGGFLRDFGHRGVNEFDPTVAAWEQAPDLVLALVARLVGDRRSTEAERPPPSRGLGLRATLLVRAARSALHRAEVSKNAVVLFTHQIRLVLAELGRRLADRISTDDLRMLTLDDLRSVATGAPVPRELIERRRAEVAAAGAVEPSVWSLGSLSLAPPVDHRSDAGADGVVISGVGGSAGVVRGRVRLLVDPYADIDDGEILVSSITDVAWTPLFLVAAAVVTDVGGLLSHATIVARDLGIPAVVDTGDATGRLRDGDLVEVDGTLGTVRVLQRATETTQPEAAR